MDRSNQFYPAQGSGATGEATPPKNPALHEANSPLDVVWQSPVSTGSSWGLALRSTLPLPNQDSTTSPSNTPTLPVRHVVAFESDLLDNAFVHWDDERPTLEMIAGFKPETSSIPNDRIPVESLTSASASLEDTPYTAITRVSGGPDLIDDGRIPFQPDTSAGIAGPAPVRKDGIEDPLKGWRPTGLVFFETLSTPPRGIVYSSTMQNVFDPGTPDNYAEAPAAAPGAHDLQDHSPASDTPAPFFDFPDQVGAAPPEETEDFPLKPVVITGGRGGNSGGTFFVRALGRLFFLIFGLGLLAIVAGFGMYGWYAKQRIYDGSSGGRSIVVTVSPGESFRSIIEGMHKDGLLKGFMGLDDRYLMRYLAYFYEDSDKIKPGVYRFSTGQDLNTVYRKLIEGSKDYKITIPEGKTALEVGEQVAKSYKGFDATYFNQLVHDPEFIKSLGIEAPSLEGYLYPSTYYFGPGMKEEELIKLMVNTFHKKMESIQDKITTDGLTLHEHIIMASLIEREARMDEDRPLIASVIFNRIEKGMPLQIDATVNYALNDWRRLRNVDYQVEHPYNTYKFKGLPPGPITSPRIESILATYTAPKTNYFYYVHKGDGHHAFAETYPQHQANVGRYIRERNTSGMGNAPTAGPMASATAANAARLGSEADAAQENEIKVYLESQQKEPAMADEETPDSDSRSESPESPGRNSEPEPTTKNLPQSDPEPEKEQPPADEPEAPASADRTPAPKSY